MKALIAAQQFKRLAWAEQQEKILEDCYAELVSKADEKKFKKSLYDLNRRETFKSIIANEKITEKEEIDVTSREGSPKVVAKKQIKKVLKVNAKKKDCASSEKKGQQVLYKPKKVQKQARKLPETKFGSAQADKKLDQKAAKALADKEFESKFDTIDEKHDKKVSTQPEKNT